MSTSNLPGLSGANVPLQVAPAGGAAPEVQSRLHKMLVLELVRSFVMYGGTTHRAETLGSTAAEALGIHCQISALPSVFIASFNNEVGNPASSETHCVNFDGELDAHRLAEVEKIAHAIVSRSMAPAAAAEALLQLRTDKMTLYSVPVKIAAVSISSGTSALAFFGGGWDDALFCLIAGLGIGLFLYLIGPKFPRVMRTAEFVCGAWVGFLVRGVGGPVFGDSFCPVAATLSSIVWLLPGLTVTTSITELAAGSIVSGTSRFFKGVLLSFQLGFGIVIGDSMASFVPNRGSLPTECVRAAKNAEVVWVLVTIVLFAVLLNAHYRQLWPIGATAVAGWLALFLLTDTPGTSLSPEAATVVSSLAIGVAGSSIVRVSGHQSLVVVTVAILILVPGSLGVRGAGSLLSGDGVSGVTFGVAMVATAFSISMGLIIARTLVSNHFAPGKTAANEKSFIGAHDLSLM